MAEGFNDQYSAGEQGLGYIYPERNVGVYA